MSRAHTLIRSLRFDRTTMLRALLVNACALALILAGQAQPF